MATGYATAVLTADTQLTAHRPGIKAFLPSGWTDLTVSRAEAYKRVKRDVLAKVPAGPHKEEYLARLEDNTQLTDAEIYAALSHFFAAIMVREGDAHHAAHQFYEKRYAEFWKAVNLEWDDSIDVTETNTNARAVPQYGLLERV